MIHYPDTERAEDLFQQTCLAQIILARSRNSAWMIVRDDKRMSLQRQSIGDDLAERKVDVIQFLRCPKVCVDHVIPRVQMDDKQALNRRFAKIGQARSRLVFGIQFRHQCTESPFFVIFTSRFVAVPDYIQSVMLTIREAPLAVSGSDGVHGRQT